MKEQRHITPAFLTALARGDLPNCLTAATPGGIEAQEAQGQRDLVNAPRVKLPRKGIGCLRTDLEALGIVFHEEADDLFVYVTLPDGWKLVPTDHSMWAHLIDEHGGVRAKVFYKAAFYDRHAHISVNGQTVL